ncbi:MAG: ZIP family metal transporter [Actinobacteria bacterium]|nr:MAG: ZIP family metal transporter [Actinomycetota bacterium]
MEARALPVRRSSWLSGILPLILLGGAILLFVGLDAPGLERRGIPIEDVAVERTTLRPGVIELRLRNDGPDPVRIEQVVVNDRFTNFSQTHQTVGRLGSDKLTIIHPWVEGEAYEIAMVTATGGTIGAEVPVATESPQADAGFFGLMALIGLYVGVIPVAIGMLWLPWIRQIDPRWIQFVLALTVGLLAFLAIDAVLEGLEFAGEGAKVFGGQGLVFMGGVVSYLLLAGVDAWVRSRGAKNRASGVSGMRVALLIALGIGMHNLGEGLAIGSSYAIGALALGATLVVGFALHNTTEGLAVVAPIARDTPPLRRLIGLGVLAGAPAVVGAWIGASAFDTSLAAFLFGLGAGAIAQVIVQLAPSIRDRNGSVLNPLTTGGLLTGLALMYVTALAIPV